MASLKTNVFALALATATLAGGVLVSCSSPSSNQAQAPNTPTASPASNSQEMAQSGMHHGHGGMDHSMAMDLGPADADYDLRFIDAMILHHQGAVDMAKEVQQKSQRADLKKLADDVIKAQEKEIADMKQWRSAWYPKASSTPMAYDAKGGKMAEMTAEQKQNMMMSMDLGTSDEKFDLRFIDAMIPHHEGAVFMAQDALKKSQRPEMKTLSEAIISSQQKEIDQMKQWKKAWYNQ